jgi:hypothetical protein
MLMSRLTVLGAAFSVLAFGAQAVTVDLIASSQQGFGNTAHVYAANYSGSTPPGGSFSADALVVPPPGNMAGIYQSPFNNTPLLDTQSYFSVGAVDINGVGAPSPVTLTLGAPVDSFTMLWGSIDSYNTIEFFSGMTPLMAFSGTDIINALMLGGSPINYEQVALLRFGDFGQGGLTSVKFSSSQAAFEFALDDSLTAVPLPASALLLLAGLGGFGFLSRRGKAAAA